MKNYKLSFIGLILSNAVLLGTMITGFDLFEILAATLERLERYEIDEFIVPIMILGTFVSADMVRRHRSQKIEIKKIKIYKAMMASSHHILNNFINQVQLFKITAEDTPGFDPEVLSMYDQTIEDATLQMEALGSITNIDEASIRASVVPRSNTT